MPQHDMQKQSRKRLWFILKLVFTLASIAWCVHVIDLEKVRQLLHNADRQLLAWLVPLVVLQIAGGALRFKYMVDPHFSMSYLQHLRQYFIANYFNLILPSSIGGDAVRVFLLDKQGLSKTRAATYIFSERLMGLYSLVLIALSAGFAVSLSDDIHILAITLTMLSAVSLTAFPLLMYITRNTRQPQVVAAREALKGLWSDKARLAGTVALSLVYQLLTVSFTLLVARAFHLDVSLMMLLALVPLVWLVTFLPISFGGLGVREVSFIGLFTQVGLSSEQAIFLSLGTYAAMLLAGMLGGAWTLLDAIDYRQESD
jgi:uncharacterized membrane protein YbhN (UPF0104 family)